MNGTTKVYARNMHKESAQPNYLADKQSCPGYGIINSQESTLYRIDARLGSIVRIHWYHKDTRVFRDFYVDGTLKVRSVYS